MPQQGMTEEELSKQMVSGQQFQQGRRVYYPKAVSRECEPAWTVNLEICNIAIKCKINSEVEVTCEETFKQL